MGELFKWFTLGTNMSVVYCTWFTEIYDPEDFEGIDKLLVAFIRYCGELGLSATLKNFEVFLKIDGKKYVKKYNVRVDTLTNFNYDEPAAFEEAYNIISFSALQTFSMYCNKCLEGREFKLDVIEFMAQEKSNKVRMMMSESFQKMQSGDVDAVMESMQVGLLEIQEKYDTERLEELDAYIENEGNTEESLEFLFKTGIPCIDGDIGGTYTRQLWSFTGPPGGGKTRFAMVHIAYHAAVVGKLDVLVDALELSKMEVQNILIAHHIIHLYGGRIKIPDSVMNKGNMSAEQKNVYESAKMDLFESNGKYGQIIIETKDLSVEALPKRMKRLKSLYPKLKVWVVDYAGLVESSPIEKYSKRLEEFEVIGRLYKTGKKIAKRLNMFVFVVNQYTREGNEASMRGKTLLPGHVQGGQIIQRHSDYDIAMGMTEEEKIARMRTLSTIKVRGAVGFTNVPLSTDLAISVFKQVKEGV